jgi:hypothetical protein
MNVKIVTFVPLSHTDIVREALGKSGAGQLGEYSYCSYSIVGTGRFIPSANAKPHIGEPNKPELVTEERIEVVCNKKRAKAVIAALRAVHPYEEVAFDIYPLLDESEL